VDDDHRENKMIQQSSFFCELFAFKSANIY